MEYRGIILIVFGLSLVASPLAIRKVQQVQSATTDAEVATAIATQNQAASDCAAATISTSSYAIGCGARTMAMDDRRTAAGSAVFVSARR